MELKQQVQKIRLLKQLEQNIKNGSEVVNINGVKLDSWTPYHIQGMMRAPRPLLVNFLNSHQGKFKSALDLGAGSFADSKFIASKGIPVRAINLPINTSILLYQYLNNTFPISHYKGEIKRHSNYININNVQNNLTAQAQDFAHLNLPKTDFVYSFASLPFCPEKSFVNMLVNIASSVNKDGYIALHFFESSHPFVKNNNARGFSAEQLEDAFRLLGFGNIQTMQWQDNQTQDGKKLPNMNSIFITAQVPEQLPVFSREVLRKTLGLKAKQEEAEDPALAPVSKVYGFVSGTDSNPPSVEPMDVIQEQAYQTSSTSEEQGVKSSVDNGNAEDSLCLSALDVNLPPKEPQEIKQIYKSTFEQLTSENTLKGTESINESFEKSDTTFFPNTIEEGDMEQ